MTTETSWTSSFLQSIVLSRTLWVRASTVCSQGLYAIAYVRKAENPPALPLATLLVYDINSAGASVASFEVGSSRLLSYRVELTYHFKFNVQYIL